LITFIDENYEKCGCGITFISNVMNPFDAVLQRKGTS
jgi:hypothetical protein